MFSYRCYRRPTSPYRKAIRPPTYPLFQTQLFKELDGVAPFPRAAFPSMCNSVYLYDSARIHMRAFSLLRPSDAVSASPPDCYCGCVIPLTAPSITPSLILRGVKRWVRFKKPAIKDTWESLPNSTLARGANFTNENNFNPPFNQIPT